MKQMVSKTKKVRNSAGATRKEASAGPKGIAISPPDYGIDIVAREPVDAPPEHSKERPPLASDASIQRTAAAPGVDKENRTGLPDALKSGLEALSGFDLSDVRVHRSSFKPPQLQAVAYAQGPDIHLGRGQEKHLPHEAWHVVQQRQGRVRPTMKLNGKAINDDVGLEREADVMGVRALTVVGQARKLRALSKPKQ